MLIGAHSLELAPPTVQNSFFETKNTFHILKIKKEASEKNIEINIYIR